MTLAENHPATSRSLYIRYMDRTTDHYLQEGFNNPYQWARFEDVPFTQLEKPLSESRLGVITTAAQFQPDKGDQGPGAPYNNEAKFKRVYTLPSNEVPDLRISHIGYDRNNARIEDQRVYLPLERLHDFEKQGRFKELGPRLYGAPTLRSQRVTSERNAPEILEMCREDKIDVALLVGV